MSYDVQREHYRPFKSLQVVCPPLPQHLAKHSLKTGKKTRIPEGKEFRGAGYVRSLFLCHIPKKHKNKKRREKKKIKANSHKAKAKANRS